MTADLETRINLQIPVSVTTKLPGVGFHPWMEMDVLQQDFSKARNLEEDSGEILEKWLIKARKNLVGYWQEYIDQRLVLPINLEIAEVDKQRRIVLGGVKNVLWVNSIGAWERNGSVKESAIKIEEFLLNSPPFSAAILVSPGGHEYPDTETYIFWINSDGDIDSMTIRTDPDIDDNECFLMNTSLNFTPDTTAFLESRVEAVIRNPLFLNAENGFAFSPESIIEAIRQTKKRGAAFKSKGFEELIFDFNHRHELFEAGKLIEIIITDFSSFCLQTLVDSNYRLDDKTQSLIEERLGETVLKMSYIKRRLQGQNWDIPTAVQRLSGLNPCDYQNELRYLQTIPGCAGGGMTNYINNGFGLRETKWEYHFGVCGICGNQTGVGPCNICKSCESKF